MSRIQIKQKEFRSMINKLSQMEEFVQYKVTNPHLSHQESKKMQLKAKNKKQLDRQQMYVDRKKKQLKIESYQASKRKKYVWDKLASLGTVMNQVNDDCNQLLKQMRKIKCKKQQEAKNLAQQREEVRMQEQNLQKELQKMRQNNRKRQNQLQKSIEELVQSRQKLMESCLQIQPTIIQHNIELQVLQSVKKNISRYRQQITEYQQNIEKSTQFLEVLNNKIYQQYLKKQEDDAKEQAKCRNKIEEVILKMEQILEGEDESSWDDLYSSYMNAAKDIKEISELQKDQKFREVRDKVVGKDDKKNEKMYIKQKTSEKLCKKLETVVQKLGQIEKEWKKADKTCLQLQQQQRSRQKQLKNLQETIDKISQSLSK